MENKNQVLCNVMYDSIDMFLELKKELYILKKNLSDDDKVIMSLYLSLISHDISIKNSMSKFDYEYQIKIKKKKSKLTKEQYRNYYFKYFYKFLKSNNIKFNTTSNEFMFALLNTRIIEFINNQYNFNNEFLKKYFSRKNKFEKVLIKNKELVKKYN